MHTCMMQEEEYTGRLDGRLLAARAAAKRSVDPKRGDTRVVIGRFASTAPLCDNCVATALGLFRPRACRLAYYSSYSRSGCAQSPASDMNINLPSPSCHWPPAAPHENQSVRPRLDFATLHDFSRPSILQPIRAHLGRRGSWNSLCQSCSVVTCYEQWLGIDPIRTRIAFHSSLPRPVRRACVAKSAPRQLRLLRLSPTPKRRHGPGSRSRRI
ncbi:hypothetical protein BDY17DRAFT_130496 [Neohortaea acidophila]|uniref:Uncharacterized protein n=1 Tax=Neohortaea acidophila TaxID=245834 RepID=A0A6A6PXV0_9PEZI|nr:uncharacterized protein BDY17DRAFT_130496 [Neohortaea acidophila]KAF2484539.1 hypothetical protein BDY17DRAFT_130496 [Neohortaea acidophila]